MRKVISLLLILVAVGLGAVWFHEHMLVGLLPAKKLLTLQGVILLLVPWVLVTAAIWIALRHLEWEGVISSLFVGAIVGAILGFAGCCVFPFAFMVQPLLLRYGMEAFYSGGEGPAIRALLYYGVGGNALIGTYIGFVVFTFRNFLADR